MGLAERAKSIVRDLDPTNQLTFFRMKSESHEVVVHIINSKIFFSSLYTLQADPEKSRDFIIKNPGILIDSKSRDPGIPGIPLGPD